MSNTSAADVFAGLNGASVEERNPKYPPLTRARAKIVAVKRVDGNNGTAIVVETEVVTSTNPEVRPGELRSVPINGLTATKDQDRKRALGKVKNFLASAFGIDPTSDQKWGEIAVMCYERGAADGRLVDIQTGERTKAQSGFDYVPTAFHPAV